VEVAIMNSKTSSVFGVLGAALVAVAFAATAYAAPLLEQHRDHKVRISRNTDPLVFSHVVEDGHAAHEKSVAYVARRSTYRDPFVHGHCRWATMQQGSGTIVSHGISYDTSRVQICD
jgi:hypothetical protein